MGLEKQARIRITAKTDQAVGEMEKLRKASDKAGEAFSALRTAGKAVGGTANAVGVIAAGLGAFDRGITALSKYTAVLQNLPFSIDAAAKSTQGFISRSALMDSALVAHRAGVVKTAEEYAKFAANVQAVAMTRGQDATEAMEVLTGAIARNETELLDNYGIILKVDQAQKLYAEQLGKVQKELTATERAQAFSVIAMQKLNDVAASSKTELPEVAVAWMKLKASVTDFPMLLHDASESLYENMVALREWDEQMGRNIAGVSSLIGDHRRGVGFKGLAAAAREATAAMFEQREMAETGTIGALKKWIDRQVERGAAVGKLGADAMNDAAKKTGDELIIPTIKRQGKQISQAMREFQRMRDEVLRGQMKRENSDTREFGQAARDAQMGAVVGAIRSQRQADADDALAMERTKIQSVLEIKLQGVEQMQAAGLDPYSLTGADPFIAAQREANARMEALAAEENYLRRVMSGRKLEIAQAEIDSKRRDVLHTKELARIASEQAKREKYRAQMQHIGKSVADVHAGVAMAAMQGAFASGESAKSAVKHFAAAKTQEMGILAATEGIQAIASAAMLNFAGAEAHGIAAGMAAGEAAVLGSIYAIATNENPFTGATGPSSGKLGKDKPTTSADGGASGSSIPGGPPISRPGQHSPDGPPMPPQGAQGGGTVIYVTNQSLLPYDPAAQMLALRRALKRSEQNDGAV